MPTAEAVVATENAERYLARLCGHAGKMRQHALGRHGSATRVGDLADKPMPQVRHAEHSGAEGTVIMDRGQWTVRADPGTLTLRAEAADAESLRLIQDMLAMRLEKFGRRENLAVTWQPPAEPGTP